MTQNFETLLKTYKFKVNDSFLNNLTIVNDAKDFNNENVLNYKDFNEKYWSQIQSIPVYQLKKIKNLIDKKHLKINDTNLLIENKIKSVNNSYIRKKESHRKWYFKKYQSFNEKIEELTQIVKNISNILEKNGLT